MLRNGRVTGHVEGKGKADTRELARLMVGRDIELSPQRASHPIGHEVLQIRDLSLSVGDVEVLSNISFNIHEGEMVGIAGVAGNGQRELADTIAGLIPPTSGSIMIAGAMTGTAARSMHESSDSPTFLKIASAWGSCRQCRSSTISC